MTFGFLRDQLSVLERPVQLGELLLRFRDAGILGVFRKLQLQEGRVLRVQQGIVSGEEKNPSGSWTTDSDLGRGGGEQVGSGGAEVCRERGREGRVLNGGRRKKTIPTNREPSFTRSGRAKGKEKGAGGRNCGQRNADRTLMAACHNGNATTCPPYLSLFHVSHSEIDFWKCGTGIIFFSSSRSSVQGGIVQLGKGGRRIYSVDESFGWRKDKYCFIGDWNIKRSL